MFGLPLTNPTDLVIFARPSETIDAEEAPANSPELPDPPILSLGKASKTLVEAGG